MKKKVPKFVLARNTAAQPDSTYLVHTQNPEFIGEIHKFESLIVRNRFLEENAGKEVIQVTPTTVLVVLNYFNTNEKISDLKYLENKIVHWLIANYLNSNVI